MTVISTSDRRCNVIVFNLLVCKDCLLEARQLLRPYIGPRHSSLDDSRSITGIGGKFRFPANVEPFMDIPKALWIDILLEEIGISLEAGIFMDRKLSKHPFNCICTEVETSEQTSIFFDLGKLKNSFPAHSAARIRSSGIPWFLTVSK